MKILLNEKQIICVLQEALELSKAKEYANIQRSPEVTQKINKIFELLKQKYPDFRSSKREDRLYIPFGSQLKDEIIDALEQNEFDVTDYDNGLVVNRRNGQETKLGKVLNRIKREDLLTKYTTDKSKGAVSNPSGYMVYSKHAYDIAGMSTGRNWTSCMNLETGSNKRYVSCDISEGSFVVYLIDANDLNITNPKGRIAIKPFINQMDKSDIIFFPEDRTYGSIPSEFKDEIDNFFNGLNNETKGFVYDKNDKLYNDSNSQTYTNLKKIKTLQDVENIIFNVDDRTKKELSLQNKMVLDYVMKSPRINHYVKESIVDSSKYDEVSQYITAKYLLEFGSSNGLDDIIDRWPQLKEVMVSSVGSFKKKFPAVLLKHFPEYKSQMTEKEVRNISDTQFFDIFSFRPDLFPFFYDKFNKKMVDISERSSKNFWYFLQDNPKYIIKSYPLFKKILREGSGYNQNKFISNTLKIEPNLFNFYLYNEKELLDKFFDEPTTSNDIVYRNNKLFYLTFANYRKFIDDIVFYDFTKIIGLNPSLIPIFVKFYRSSFDTLSNHEVYKFLYYHENTIPMFVQYLPEVVKKIGNDFIIKLIGYHPKHEDELQKIL